jgi:hypothetical protein
MLGNVGQPKFVHSAGGEVAFNQIIMHRRASLGPDARFLSEDCPDPLLGAQPPHPSFTGFNSSIGEFIRDEPVLVSRILLGACQVFCVSGHGRGLVEVGVDSFWVGHGERSEYLTPSTGSSSFDEVAAAA